MPFPNLEIKVFDRHTANEQEILAAHTLLTRIRAELLPEDSPLPLEHTIENLRAIPPFVDVRIWAVWRGTEMVAQSHIAMLRKEENKHLAEFNIDVLPELRRHGIARRLLRHITDVAGPENRSLLIANTSSTVPAGEAFMKRIGAHAGLVGVTNQLRVAELDRALIRQWQAHGKAQTAQFELGFWAGPYPEADVEAMATFLDVMNTAPRGDLQVEDQHWTAQELRQIEASQAQRKIERWTMYVRDKKTREFAGYTDVTWNPRDPGVLQQGGTGVLPKYRNHGLGRWLKAAMLEKILAERPQVKRIRTGNANSNAPMLKINQELGFKPYRSMTYWQVELDKVRQYMG